jgi:hypothetical protein
VKASSSISPVPLPPRVEAGHSPGKQVPLSLWERIWVRAYGYLDSLPLTPALSQGEGGKEGGVHKAAMFVKIDEHGMVNHAGEF